MNFRANILFPFKFLERSLREEIQRDNRSCLFSFYQIGNSLEFKAMSICYLIRINLNSPLSSVKKLYLTTIYLPFNSDKVSSKMNNSSIRFFFNQSPKRLIFGT